MSRIKMYGLRWEGYYCPLCKRKSIVHCLKSHEKKEYNEDGEKFPGHLLNKLCDDRSQFCMNPNCGFWGIITDF